MMLMFLRNGEPKSSVRMMLMNERKPRPMNSGEPQGSGRGARVVGQSWNMPLVGKFWHPPAPPPQLRAPELPTSEAPMSRMTVPSHYIRSRSMLITKGLCVPVTIGGKIRLRIRGGTKARPISRNEQMREVPIRN